MPRRAGIKNAAAAVADILELHILPLGLLTLGAADTVFDINNVVCIDIVGMLACDGAVETHALDLHLAAVAPRQVGVDLVCAARGQIKIDTVDLVRDITQKIAVQDLLSLGNDLCYVVVSFADKKC